MQGNRVFLGGGKLMPLPSPKPPTPAEGFRGASSRAPFGRLRFFSGGWKTWEGRGVGNQFWTRQFETSKKISGWKIGFEIGWDVCRRLDEKVWKVCLFLWNGKPVILKYLSTNDLWLTFGWLQLLQVGVYKSFHAAEMWNDPPCSVVN